MEAVMVNFFMAVILCRHPKGGNCPYWSARLCLHLRALAAAQQLSPEPCVGVCPANSRCAG